MIQSVIIFITLRRVVAAVFPTIQTAKILDERSPSQRMFDFSPKFKFCNVKENEAEKVHPSLEIRLGSINPGEVHSQAGGASLESPSILMPDHMTKPSFAGM